MPCRQFLPLWRTPVIGAALAAALAAPLAWAQDHGAASAKAVMENPPAFTSTAKDIGQQVRAALEAGVERGAQLTVGAPKPKPQPATAAHAAAPVKPANPKASRQYIRARAATLAGRSEPIEEIIESSHSMRGGNWSYEGATGPAAWARLKPEFGTCASGQRQSPINIDQSATLRGPAEAIGFDYQASSATMVNNGHTVQADVTGDNGIHVRGSRFHLLQLHFHHPSEERINYRSFAMVAHLVHRDHMGRLAVVAVLLEPGAANPVIDKLWTYMPLDKDDRVPMPMGSLDLRALLPKDQRYYQFMGSLTTPPCTEDVLWLVLKQAVTISHEQLRLFAQQFPNNARPVQPTNGRVVRDAQ